MAMLSARMLGDAGCWAGMSFSLASRILRCAVKRQRASRPPKSGAPPPSPLPGQAAMGRACCAAVGAARGSQGCVFIGGRRPAEVLGPSSALIASISPEKAMRPLLAG